MEHVRVWEAKEAILEFGVQKGDTVIVDDRSGQIILHRTLVRSEAMFDALERAEREGDLEVIPDEDPEVVGHWRVTRPHPGLWLMVDDKVIGHTNGWMYCLRDLGPWARIPDVELEVARGRLFPDDGAAGGRWAPWQEPGWGN